VTYRYRRIIFLSATARDAHGDQYRIATEMVIGKTVEEAMTISRQGLADALGGIPEYKMVCSNPAPDAIRKALEEWRNRQPFS
jgi:hypothetical protein